MNDNQGRRMTTTRRKRSLLKDLHPRRFCSFLTVHVAMNGKSNRRRQHFFGIFPSTMTSLAGATVKISKSRHAVKVKRGVTKPPHRGQNLEPPLEPCLICQRWKHHHWLQVLKWFHWMVAWQNNQFFAMCLFCDQHTKSITSDICLTILGELAISISRTFVSQILHSGDENVTMTPTWPWHGTLNLMGRCTMTTNKISLEQPFDNIFAMALQTTIACTAPFLIVEWSNIADRNLFAPFSVSKLVSLVQASESKLTQQWATLTVGV